MVGGREALIVHSACAARGDDHAFCASNQNLFGFHIHQNGPAGFAFIVLNKFDCRGEINHRNLSVQHFVAESAHDFRAAVVLCRVHTFSGRAAAVGGDHNAARVLVELDAQIVKPFYGFRSVHNQFFQKLRFCREVAAAESVQIVLHRAVVGFVRRLNAALGHHGVGVADSKLCNDHNVCARLVCLYCRAGACSAAADNQNVNVVIRMLEIYFLVKHAASALQNVGKLDRHFVAFVRTDF